MELEDDIYRLLNSEAVVGRWSQKINRCAKQGCSQASSDVCKEHWLVGTKNVFS